MDNRHLRPWLIGAAILAALLGAIGLSHALAWELRTGLAQGAPFRTVLCMGCTTVAMLGGAVGLLVGITRRFISGRGPQRAILVSGLALLMSLAPLVMMMVVYLAIIGQGR